MKRFRVLISIFVAGAVVCFWSIGCDKGTGTNKGAVQKGPQLQPGETSNPLMGNSADEAKELGHGPGAGNQEIMKQKMRSGPGAGGGPPGGGGGPPSGPQ